MSLFVPLLVVAIVVILVVATLRARSQRQAPAPSLPESTLPALPEPAAPADAPSAPPRALSPRELRESLIQERLARSEVCLYCVQHATHAHPHVAEVQPWWAWVFRRLNVPVPVRYQLHPPVEVPEAALYCAAHASMVTGKIERRLAQHTVDYAEFVDTQRREMYEFLRYGLDEQLQVEVALVARGRKKKQAPAGDNVVSMLKAKEKAG